YKYASPQNPHLLQQRPKTEPAHVCSTVGPQSPLVETRISEGVADAAVTDETSGRELGLLEETDAIVRLMEVDAGATLVAVLDGTLSRELEFKLAEETDAVARVAPVILDVESTVTAVSSLPSVVTTVAVLFLKTLLVCVADAEPFMTFRAPEMPLIQTDSNDRVLQITGAPSPRHSHAAGSGVACIYAALERTPVCHRHVPASTVPVAFDGEG
ncbi:hypothetical protein LTR60_007684, partial [Cryomyces antarcticus]